MNAVKSVRQMDFQTITWRVEILGRKVIWESRITHQIPDKRISWRSTSGRRNEGSVYFTPVTTKKTKMTFIIEYESSGMMEKLANAMGAISFCIGSDLNR